MPHFGAFKCGHMPGKHAGLSVSIEIGTIPQFEYLGGYSNCKTPLFHSPITPIPKEGIPKVWVCHVCMFIYVYVHIYIHIHVCVYMCVLMLVRLYNNLISASPELEGEKKQAHATNNKVNGRGNRDIKRGS